MIIAVKCKINQILKIHKSNIKILFKNTGEMKYDRAYQFNR